MSNETGFDLKAWLRLLAKNGSVEAEDALRIFKELKAEPKQLKVGNFTIEKSLRVRGLDRENTIWLEKDNGEGTDVDLHKWFRRLL